MKKRKYIIISIIAAIALCIGAVSYALWQQTLHQTNENEIISACIDLTFDSETAEITMDNAYPVSDSVGMSITGYSFTITNHCSRPISYIVALEKINDNSGVNFIGDNYIKVALDDITPQIYGDLRTITNDTEVSYNIINTRKIALRNINAGETRTHIVKLWMDSHTPDTEQNKKFVSKVRITGGQGFDEDCYIVDALGNLTQYKEECGMSATIPAAINGIKVKNITSDAFKKNILDYTYSGTTALNQVDFSLVYNTNAINLAKGTATASEIENLTSDDFYIVKYNTDTTNQNVINMGDAIDGVLDDLETQVEGSIVDVSEIRSYTNGLDDTPNQEAGVYEAFYTVSESGGVYTATKVGYRTPSGTSTQRLVIDSLDLSNALNLESIEQVAFSNAPKQSGSRYNNVTWANVPYGLTTLSFGSNTNSIRFGTAAFAKSNLNTLTLYNTLPSESLVVPGNDYINQVPFNQSTIGTLNIVKSGDSSEYNTVKTASVCWGCNADDYKYGIFGQSTIERINIGAGITRLGPGTFRGVDFHEFNTPSSLTSLGRIAIAPTTVASTYGLNIGSSSIATIEANSLKTYRGPNDNLVIPGTLKSIPANGFEAFKGKTITIGAGVESIGASAFKYFNGTKVTLNEGLITIGDNAFYNGTFATTSDGYYGTGQELVIPNTVKTIGNYAFAKFNGNSLVLGSNIESIGSNAFLYYGNGGVTTPITIPKTIKSIGQSAFGYFQGTIYIDMTQAEFEALSGINSSWKNSNATVVFKSS